MVRYEISVNFKENKITIKEVYEKQLFSKIGRYVLEGDSGGFSCLELKDNKISHKNYIKEPYFGNALVDSKTVTEAEARKLIKEHLLEKLRR